MIETDPLTQAIECLSKTADIIDDHLATYLGEDARWEYHVGVDLIPEAFSDYLPIGSNADSTRALWLQRKEINSLCAWLTRDHGPAAIVDAIGCTDDSCPVPG